MIIDELIEDAQPRLAQRRIADARIGLSYTAVLLDDGSCGLAATDRGRGDACCSDLSDSGQLIGQYAEVAAQQACSASPVASSIGVATLNAVLNRRASRGPDPLDVLPVDGARVGMIGRFEPYLAQLQDRANVLHVFERRPATTTELPDWAAERLLPDCDVVIITSLTLVNKTLDHLLDLTRGTVALVGPTTPMSPVFAAQGVHHLFGRIVADAAQVLTVISQGGGTRHFGEAAPKAYLDLTVSPPTQR